MKTAVIYARYSCDNQTEQSIEGQLRVCEEYAQRNNIVILDTYIDRAMTGTNDNRPDFQRMIKDSKKREWDYVLVYKLDRFSRNKYESVMHKRTLKENGVKVVSAMENIPDTPEGIILESLLEGMNQYYSAELAQKLKRGMEETRRKGNFTGGYMIYGYDVINHKVVINEEQAEVVRYIFKQYAMGTYVKDIMQYLNENKIYNRGKPFTRTVIYALLKNEKYLGVYKHENKIYDNIYPQIVSYEVFEKVKRKTELNKYGRHTPDIIYLLKNKLVCGYCGKPMTAETGTSKKCVVMRYYKCSGRKLGNGCTKTTISKDSLEKFVIDAVTQRLNHASFRKQLVDQIYNLQEQQYAHNTILEVLNKEKSKAQKALENMLRAIEQGVVNNSTNKRILELEGQIEELERQIIIQQSINKLKLSKADIEKYYLDALKQEPLILVNYIISKIVLFDDKVEIHFNKPIKVSPENQGLFFYAENKLLIHKSSNNKTIMKQNIVIEYYT